MRLSSKRRAAGCVVLVSFGAPAALITYAVWDEHAKDLAAHSTRITQFGDTDDYAWRSNDEAVVIRGIDLKHPGNSTPDVDKPVRPLSAGNWVIVNAQTGAEMPAASCGPAGSPACTALEALFNNERMLQVALPMEVETRVETQLKRPWGSVRNAVPAGHGPENTLVWLSNATVYPGPLAPLHRWIPAIQNRAMKAREIWLSRGDGTGLRLLGRLAGLNGVYTQTIYPQFSWLPDGKRLSYVYGHALYTVAVE